jgi:hypothetical protein
MSVIGWAVWRRVHADVGGRGPAPNGRARRLAVQARPISINPTPNTIHGVGSVEPGFAAVEPAERER